MVLAKTSLARPVDPFSHGTGLARRAVDASPPQLGHQQVDHLLERAGYHHVGNVEAVKVGDGDPLLQDVGHLGRRAHGDGSLGADGYQLANVPGRPLGHVLAVVRQVAEGRVDSRVDRHVVGGDLLVQVVPAQVDAQAAGEKRQTGLVVGVFQGEPVLLVRLLLRPSDDGRHGGKHFDGPRVSSGGCRGGADTLHAGSQDVR